MALIVQKYGGTSVGTVERIRSVAKKVEGFRDQGHDVVVVVSFFQHAPDREVEGVDVYGHALQRGADVLAEEGAVAA